MSVRIHCINKDNGDHYDPHEAITNLGWVNEANGERNKCTRLEMVTYIESGNQAYVKSAFGKVAYLIVKISPYGNKFVKTKADGVETNNLLSLPECK